MKKLKKYKDLFEGKLFIEDENTFDQDIKWEYSIDISKIWKDFKEGVLDINSYNKELAIKLEENINNLKDFKIIIKDLKNTHNNEESISLWNKLYDIADKNLIELKA